MVCCKQCILLTNGKDRILNFSVYSIDIWYSKNIIHNILVQNAIIWLTTQNRISEEEGLTSPN